MIEPWIGEDLHAVGLQATLQRSVAAAQACEMRMIIEQKAELAAGSQRLLDAFQKPGPLRLAPKTIFGDVEVHQQAGEKIEAFARAVSLKKSGMNALDGATHPQPLRKLGAKRILDVHPLDLMISGFGQHGEMAGRALQVQYLSGLDR